MHHLQLTFAHLQKSVANEKCTDFASGLQKYYDPSPLAKSLNLNTSIQQDVEEYGGSTTLAYDRQVLPTPTRLLGRRIQVFY